jgi:hypothetical protein
MKKAMKLKLPTLLDPSQNIQVKCWRGHAKPITFMNNIDEPRGFITCSFDRHVRIWSREGTLWGDIYLAKERIHKNWSFPF